MEICTKFGHGFGTSIFQIKDVCVILTLEMSDDFLGTKTISRKVPVKSFLSLVTLPKLKIQFYSTHDNTEFLIH
jgi:hypothetical protein